MVNLLLSRTSLKYLHRPIYFW